MSEGPVPDPPAETPAKDKTTVYVVLVKKEVAFKSNEGEDAAAGSAWVVGREYATRTPKKAIESYMKDEGLTEGEFVAVPKRHWTIETPTVVTTERLAF